MVEVKDLVLNNGVRCIADIHSELYAKLKKESQAATPWIYQKEYGKFVTYFIAVIIFLCLIKKLAFMYYDSSEEFLPEKKDSPITPPELLARIMKRLVAFNRYICYRKFPTLIFSYLGIPTSVGTFLVVMAATLYTLLYCFVPHPFYRPCAGFGSPPLSVRAGIMAVSLVPFVFSLSGKVNVIGWLVGLSYEKINIYHQWASILCLFFSWVHVIPFLRQARHEGGYERMHQQWKASDMWRSGVPPILFLNLLWLFSLPVARRYIYEIFLQVHWILAVGFYISLFYHVYPELNSHMYLVATIVVWFAQLFYRLAAKGYLRPGRSFMASTIANVSVVGEGCVELIVKDVEMAYSPGQHIFVRTIDKDVISSHPFSIFPSAKYPGGVKILIRAQKGFTKRLYESRDEMKKILIDGPYGGIERNVRSFTNVYLICSGSGISTCLPFLQKYGPIFHKTNLESITLDWLVRHREDISWIEDEIYTLSNDLRQLFLDGRIVIRIYVCSSSTVPDTTKTLSRIADTTSDQSDLAKKEKGTEFGQDNTESSSTLDKSKNEYKSIVTIISSKPDLNQVINGYEIGFRNCFICSGSDSLRYIVGNSVASLQAKVFSSKNVEECYLHSESFGY
ncbi:putative ferric-chelate reductase [Saccharomyces paradoxus]|uniref:ferric-chelate reductase (NADPH) n=1 Tax=Saccharomyces paradoxus TaxID=27291 RepID=A0A8B8UZ71_SACPA|nr:Fre7 [Saccharomyces paradoxus]QHS75979.1 Fre7 [Saccharomyces paradoxus]